MKKPNKPQSKSISLSQNSFERLNKGYYINISLADLLQKIDELEKEYSCEVKIKMNPYGETRFTFTKVNPEKLKIYEEELLKYEEYEVKRLQDLIKKKKESKDE